ncbi:hypothetical protein Bbelb_363520 [Branchiostoma belcheri]|nr:hypothetical protein Bbelb_363520 [Branchiostoma belcheri]
MAENVSRFDRRFKKAAILRALNLLNVAQPLVALRDLPVRPPGRSQASSQTSTYFSQWLSDVEQVQRSTDQSLSSVEQLYLLNGPIRLRDPYMSEFTLGSPAKMAAVLNRGSKRGTFSAILSLSGVQPDPAHEASRPKPKGVYV